MLCVIAKLDKRSTEKLMAIQKAAAPDTDGKPLHGHITLAAYMGEDEAGFMAFCAALLREKGLSTDVAIASDNFHQLRAAIWAQRSGLTPYSDGCASPWFLTAGYWARETAALLYMVVTGG